MIYAEIFALMTDELTDNTQKTQAAICVRWVDQNYDCHEDFVHDFETESTKADVIVEHLLDFLFFFEGKH